MLSQTLTPVVAQMQSRIYWYGSWLYYVVICIITPVGLITCYPWFIVQLRGFQYNFLCVLVCPILSYYLVCG